MPGGVVVNPPEHIRAAVKRQIPELPIERFDRIGSIYNTERTYEAQRPAGVRDATEAIGDKAADLYVRLAELSEEANDALWHAAYQRGRPNLKEEADLILQMLMGIGRDAALNVGQTPPGAQAGAKRGMVVGLACLLKSVGLDADARPSGNLVFLTRSILEAYGETHSNVPKLVRDALKTIDQN